jgi:hypothetical protein
MIGPRALVNMIGPRRVLDRTILDAIEKIEPERFNGEVWRVARKGRDPLFGSTVHGRWTPSLETEFGSIAPKLFVLYTSLARDGALAEIGYRLSLEPVWPSRIEHEIHRIEVQTERTLRLVELESLALLGVDIARYQTFEYQATQAVAAVAQFLEFDGLIVPSARFDCANLVIFGERAPGLVLMDTQPVDWDAWRRRQRK